jgi:short-subunit dehydrogenase
MNYTFISGATGGIGKAMATECAVKGYNLFLTGRSQEKLNALALELFTLNPDISVITKSADLTSEQSRKDLITFIDEKGLDFDRILHVAGVDIQKAFLDYTIEKIVFQLRVNIESTIALTYDLLKRREDKMEILVVSSMSGVTPMPYFAIYSASKNMLVNFFKALKVELKKTNTKITVVLPGGVYTREDICKDIEGQGLWGKLSSKHPDYVARKSLKALSKNKTVFVPGFFNKLLRGFMKIIPQKLQMIFIANRWKKQSKDAF